MRKPDLTVALTSVGLSLFGLLMIYSASSYTAFHEYGDAYFFVKKQAVSLVFGVALMTATAYIKLDFLKKYKYIILAVSVILLALVFIPGFGVESYGAKRWINLGLFTLQPSEYSKFGLVIFLAAFTAEKDMSKFRNVIAALAAGGAVCLLIILEPNMSITVCVGMTLLIMLFIGGVRARHLLYIGIPAALALPALIIAEPYRIKRMLAFIDPWASPQGEGYQLIQSYYALGSGGFFGVGLFNSRQKYMFLPFAESDFIFSIIGEELGLAGALAVVAVFLILIIRGFIIASRAEDRFDCYLAAGASTLIAVQTLVNIAVVSGAIPPTGLPLPFISAGGSSLVAFLCASGLILNVSAKSTQKKLKP